MKTLFEIIIVVVFALLVAWILSLGIIDDNEELQRGKTPLSGFHP